MKVQMEHLDVLYRNLSSNERYHCKIQLLMFHAFMPRVQQAYCSNYNIQIANDQWYRENYEELYNIFEQQKKMLNPQQTWVQERRLRPIYELLDGGNNKKVITEVDRTLKKNPNFPCAKVLKALALIRLNKPLDAKLILQPVVEETPTDDSTIQALSICFRELEDPVSLSRMLEAACEKEKSEELLTHCYMAHVRNSDYQKMHSTALQLYKLYNKTTYYGWAVASLYLKFEQATIPKGGRQGDHDLVTIKVACRMMEKFLNEHKGTKIDDNMVDLYIRILIRIGNWEDVIAAIKRFGKDQLSQGYEQLYADALEKTNRYDELFEYLQAAYLKDKENYDILRSIITTLAKEDFPRVDNFFNNVLDISPSRTSILAAMQLALYYCETDAGVAKIRTLLPRAIEYGGGKPSFYSDIIQYFRVVDRQSQFELMQYISPRPSKGVPNFDTITKIIRDVNFEMAFRDYIDQDDKELTRIRHANVCFGKYLVCDELIESLRTEENLRTKESDFHDQYIIIAACSLIFEYYKSPKLKEKHSLDSYLQSGKWAEIEKEDCDELHQLKARLEFSGKNGQSEDNVDSISTKLQDLSTDESVPTHLRDKEALLTFAICVLEYGLSKSPYNYSMRILLSRLYAMFGAVGHAIKVMQALDLKHVQWDSLGYLIIPLAISSGTYSDAGKMLNAAEAVYLSYRRECMEHVISAYKYGSFDKISEFLLFRNQLLNSIQFLQVFTEKRLLDMVTFTGNYQEWEKLILAVVNDIETKIQDHSLVFNTDNRDFTVIEQFLNEIPVPELKEISIDPYHTHQDVRRIFLTIIAYLMSLCRPNVLNIDVLKTYQVQSAKLINEWLEKFGPSISQVEGKPQLYGIWPPRYLTYFGSKVPVFLSRQMHLLIAMLDENEKPQVMELEKLIEEQGTLYLDTIRCCCNDLRKYHLLMPTDKHIQYFHYSLETLSLTRYTVQVTNYFTKNFVKQKAKAKNQIYKKTMISCTECLIEKLKLYTEEISKYITELKALPLPNMDNMETQTKDLLSGSFLSIAFQNSFAVAQKNIRESHLNQLDEMRKLSVSLVDCIRNTILCEINK